MTNYEYGFLTKCASAGVPEEVAKLMLKVAAPPANWRATRPVRSMGQVNSENMNPANPAPMYGNPGFAGDPKRLRAADKGKPMPRRPVAKTVRPVPAPAPAPAP